MGISGVSCDFEIDLCAYKQDTTDKFDWTKNSGDTDSYDTGPPQDHTYGTAYGKYWWHFVIVDKSHILHVLF